MQNKHHFLLVFGVLTKITGPYFAVFVLIHYICTNYLIHIITLMMIFWSSEKQARIGQWLGGKSTSMYFVFCILYHCHKNINEPFQCWQTNHINLISQSVYTCVISNWHSLLYIDIVIINVIYCHHICMKIISQSQGTDNGTGTSRLTFCPFLSSGVAPRIGLS